MRTDRFLQNSIVGICAIIACCALSAAARDDVEALEYAVIDADHVLLEISPELRNETMLAAEHRLWLAVQRANDRGKSMSRNVDLRDRAISNLAKLALLQGELGAALNYARLGQKQNETSARSRGNDTNWRKFRYLEATVLVLDERAGSARAILETMPPLFDPLQPCVGVATCPAEELRLQCDIWVGNGVSKPQWVEALQIFGPRGNCAAQSFLHGGEWFSDRSRPDLAERLLRAALAVDERPRLASDAISTTRMYATDVLVNLLIAQSRTDDASSVAETQRRRIPSGLEAKEFFASLRNKIAYAEDMDTVSDIDARIESNSVLIGQLVYDGPHPQNMRASARVLLSRVFREQAVLYQRLGKYTEALEQLEYAETYGVPSGILLSDLFAEASVIKSKLGDIPEALRLGHISNREITSWLRTNSRTADFVQATLRARLKTEEARILQLSRIRDDYSDQASIAKAQAFEIVQIFQINRSQVAVEEAAVRDKLIDPEVRQRLQKRQYPVQTHNGVRSTKDVPPIDAWFEHRYTDVAPRNLSETQRLLGPKETLLVIHSLNRRTEVFAVTRERVLWKSISLSEDALRAMTQQLLNSLTAESEKQQPVDVSTAREIYAAVIAPVAPLLADNTVFASVTGPLGALPLGVLAIDDRHSSTGSTEPGQKHWLAQRNAIVVLPSVSSIANLRSRPTSRRRDALIAFGDPPDGTVDSSGQKLSTLKHARAEIELLSHSVRSGRVKVFLGPQFTKKNIMQTDLSSVRVLVFATHATDGIPGTSEPSLLLTPSRAMSGDAWLRASDIAKLQIGADIVALSACRTAKDSSRSEEEPVSGLAYAFLFAGARTVLASRWDVLDSAAFEIVGSSLAVVATPTTVATARALQSQINTLVAGADPLRSSPRFWGPFLVVGG
jgi:CHAT domain-containing protein/tetratricopeptide (TPR) repeat protein